MPSAFSTAKKYASSSMAVKSSSTMFLKFFHPSVALYWATVPFGTYNVALEYVSESNVSSLMANGFASIEVTFFRFLQFAKARSSMLVTLLGMVTDSRLLQS